MEEVPDHRKDAMVAAFFDELVRVRKFATRSAIDQLSDMRSKSGAPVPLDAEQRAFLTAEVTRGCTLASQMTLVHLTRALAGGTGSGDGFGIAVGPFDCERFVDVGDEIDQNYTEHYYKAERRAKR